MNRPIKALTARASKIPKYFLLLRAFGHMKVPFLSSYTKQRILHLFADKKNPEPARWKSYYYEVRNNKIIYSGFLGNYIDWFAFFFGADEKKLLDNIYRPILASSRDPVYIDIGGNIGHHALYLSRHASIIHSFEPVASCLAEFKRKLSLAGITNVILHDYALGESCYEAEISCSTSFNGGTNSFSKDHDQGNTFDELVRVNAFDELDLQPLSHIALVKIDVEGFECNVLLGMSESIRIYRPFIVCELSKQSHKLFTEKGYSLQSCLPIDYILLDADRLSLQYKIDWQQIHLSMFQIGPDFKGNVLCAPVERLNNFRCVSA